MSDVRCIYDIIFLVHINHKAVNASKSNWLINPAHWEMTTGWWYLTVNTKTEKSLVSCLEQRYYKFTFTSILELVAWCSSFFPSFKSHSSPLLVNGQPSITIALAANSTNARTQLTYQGAFHWIQSTNPESDYLLNAVSDLIHMHPAVAGQYLVARLSGAILSSSLSFFKRMLVLKFHDWIRKRPIWSFLLSK